MALLATVMVKTLIGAEVLFSVMVKQQYFPYCYNNQQNENSETLTLTAAIVCNIWLPTKADYKLCVKMVRHWVLKE